MAARLTLPNENHIEVIPVGARVYLDGNCIHATVHQIGIRANNAVWYQCVWWNGKDRKSEWVEAFEIKSEETPQRIGFHQHRQEGN